MCEKIISENPFMLNFCPDKYITQEICDEAVDDFLPTLHFFLIGLLQVKWLKSLLLLCVEIKMHSI